MKQQDILPGFPDALAKIPPKAREYAGRTLDEAIAGAHALVDEALERYGPDHVFTLYSGGEDSVVLTHLMRSRSDALVHIDTGTGIADTLTHVRDVSAAWGKELLIPKSPDAYEDLVLGNVVNKTGPNAGKPVWLGFPGPGAHDVMYQRLKERALDELRASVVGRRGRKRGRSGEMTFLAGMRWAESNRRFRNASELDPDGAIIWVSPIVWWTEGHMREYRERFRCRLNHQHAPHMLCTPETVTIPPHSHREPNGSITMTAPTGLRLDAHPDCPIMGSSCPFLQPSALNDPLPRNEVTCHLHRSGDCQCGAYAQEGEIHGIELFYPGRAAAIHDLEQCAERQGNIPPQRCKWGWGAGLEEPSGAGRICSNCKPPEQIEGQEAFDITGTRRVGGEAA